MVSISNSRSVKLIFSHFSLKLFKILKFQKNFIKILFWQKLSNMKIDPNRFISANLPVNQRKNRLVNILPFEVTRVCLQPIRGVDGSDYINASFVDGYKDRSTYIATQGPLPETVEDFWRMLWEHNSTIVVMLTKLREMGKVRKCSFSFHVKISHQKYVKLSVTYIQPNSNINLTQVKVK